jgi:hypothetical protein
MHQSICAQSFYDIPGTISSRKAAFGFGKKFDFTKISKDTPAPSHYKIKYLGDRSKKGGSFALGREVNSFSLTLFVWAERFDHRTFQQKPEPFSF